MPEYRFYKEGPLEKGPISLEGVEHRHLSTVMRRKTGDTVEVINGEGCLAEGCITECNKKQTTLNIVSIFQEPRPVNQIILAQALPRSNRLDTIIEKCTELGVTEFWLFPGDRSERKTLSHNQQERLHGITIAAMKQSGRLYRPMIKYLPTIKEWKSVSVPMLFGDFESTEGPERVEDVALVIGPESGLSEAEIRHLKTNGATGILLNQNILRTDTAAIAGIAIIDNCRRNFRR